MNNSMKEQILQKTRDIESVIYKYLPPCEGYPRTVICAMHYTMKAGGKRLRPMLMEETYLMFGGKEREVIEPFMAAIEMIHTYSLIHDDLPAMDNDDYRRGKKTAHVVYGEDMAILAGDALLNYAFETAAGAFNGTERDCTVARAFQVLCRKPGIYGMIGGQTADTERSGRPMDLPALLYIHENKTSALIECAMMIGGILAGAGEEEIRQVEQIAKKVGLAFQIQDDILDVTGRSEIIGKPVGSDERNQKQTYVSLKGLEEAKKDAARYTRDAIDLFDRLNKNNPYLRALLLSLADRDY